VTAASADLPPAGRRGDAGRRSYAGPVTATAEPGATGAAATDGARATAGAAATTGAAASTGATEAARPGLAAQLLRFVLVGGFSALVDYGVYQGLLALDVWVHGAKGLSFVVGTTTAYLLNRRFTFRARGSRARFAGFVALYATTFCVNVGVNALALAVLPQAWWEITLAFVIAQGTATTINFVMLRTVVFRS
jgi:putative flippase GtrA